MVMFTLERRGEEGRGDGKATRDWAIVRGRGNQEHSGILSPGGRGSLVWREGSPGLALEKILLVCL